MKMELTEKDVKLLKVMLTLLLAVLMVRFLIMPALERHQELSLERDEAKLKQEEMQYSIDGIETGRAAVEKAKAGLEEISSSYYKWMEQDEVDEIVTGLAYKHNLFPSRLTIGEHTDAALAPYLYSEKGQEASDSNPEEGVQTKNYMQSVEAAISLVGTEENALALLDDIEKNYPSLQVKSFNVGRITYMNASMNLVEETQTNVVLAVYMCKKSEENQ